MLLSGYAFPSRRVLAEWPFAALLSSCLVRVDALSTGTSSREFDARSTTIVRSLAGRLQGIGNQ